MGNDLCQLSSEPAANPDEDEEDNESRDEEEESGEEEDEEGAGGRNKQNKKNKNVIETHSNSRQRRQEQQQQQRGGARVQPQKSDAEKLTEFTDRFCRGMELTKFGRNSVAKKRIFQYDTESRTFTWKVPMYRLASQKAPGQGPVYHITDVLVVRRAFEPDPKMPAFGGTETLRKCLSPEDAGKAFILDMADNRTIDLVASSELEAKDLVDGFKRLIDFVKTTN